MFIMLSVASVCAVVLIAGLLRLACRYRKDLWIVADDAILCVVAPVLILLATFGGTSLGWRIAHGGFAAVSVEGWIGAALIVAAAAGLWRVLARWLRAGGRQPASTVDGPASTVHASN